MPKERHKKTCTYCFQKDCIFHIQVLIFLSVCSIDKFPLSRIQDDILPLYYCCSLFLQEEKEHILKDTKKKKKEKNLCKRIVFNPYYNIFDMRLNLCLPFWHSFSSFQFAWRRYNNHRGYIQDILLQKGVPYSPPTPTILAGVWCISEISTTGISQAAVQSVGALPPPLLLLQVTSSSTHSVVEGKTADIYLCSLAQFIILAWKAPPMLWAS